MKTLKVLNQTKCELHMFLFSMNQSDLFQFSERDGPTEMLDGSRKALEYFEIVELVEKFKIFM